MKVYVVLPNQKEVNSFGTPKRCVLNKVWVCDKNDERIWMRCATTAGGEAATQDCSVKARFRILKKKNRIMYGNNRKKKKRKKNQWQQRQQQQSSSSSNKAAAAATASRIIDKKIERWTNIRSIALKLTLWHIHTSAIG